MKLSELKKSVDGCLERGCDGNEDVVITIKHRSMGVRAFTGVMMASTGIDWEQGQFRIEPEDDLRRDGRTLDDALKTINIKYIYNNRSAVVEHCPNCEYKIYKDYNYCPKCGQRLLHHTEIHSQHDYGENGR